jgi:hypothetical protein
MAHEHDSDCFPGMPESHNCDFDSECINQCKHFACIDIDKQIYSRARNEMAMMADLLDEGYKIEVHKRTSVKPALYVVSVFHNSKYFEGTGMFTGETLYQAVSTAWDTLKQ